MRSLKWGVCDIENHPDGRVISIATRIDDEVVDHMHWRDWLVWLENQDVDRLYAHNGGGWDWLSLLDYLNSIGYSGVEGCRVGSRMIAMKLPFENHTITLADSYCLFQDSLDRVGKVLTGTGKVECDMMAWDLWKHDRKKYWEYLHQDVNLLYDSIEKFMEVLEELGYEGSPGLTIAGMALRLWQKSYAPVELVIPKNEKVRRLSREAYTGGRVEVFRPGEHGKVNVYDVNSLYPAMMYMYDYPYSDEIIWTTKPDYTVPGVFRVLYSEPKTDKPPLLGLGENIPGIFYTPELRELIHIGGKVEILEGFNFLQYGNIFEEYVKKMYATRMKHKHDALGYCCKMLMNHLYGKFAEKPVSTNLIRIDSYNTIRDKVERGNKLRPVERNNKLTGWYTEESDRDVRHEFTAISGMVTSYARVHLYRLLTKESIYCDTDSIHTPIGMNTNDKLGGLKAEFSGEGIYVGKKLYCLRSRTIGVKIRAKGIHVVKKKGDCGQKLGWRHFQRMLQGQIVTCKFTSAPTVLEVLRGKKPCRLGKTGEQRKRRIRMLT